MKFVLESAEPFRVPNLIKINSTFMRTLELTTAAKLQISMDRSFQWSAELKLLQFDPVIRYQH